MQAPVQGTFAGTVDVVEIDKPLCEHHYMTDTDTVCPVNPIHISLVSGPASYEAPKRGMDIALGLVGLAVTGLLSLFLVPLILYKSPGAPAVFKQTRIGQGGKPFTCYKFRTMQPSAEDRKHEVAHLNEVDGPVHKVRLDPRHIPDLRWLRKFSLDEMPQFLNVVRGEMSLVGPRPAEGSEVKHYTPYQLGKLAVKPGLTCTWQVEGRSSIRFVDWVEMDLSYIQNRSTRRDLELIIKTIPAVVTARGAA